MRPLAASEVTWKGGATWKNHDVDFIPSLTSTRPFSGAQTGPVLGAGSPTVDGNRVVFCPVWSRYGPVSRHAHPTIHLSKATFPSAAERGLTPQCPLGDGAG